MEKKKIVKITLLISAIIFSVLIGRNAFKKEKAYRNIQITQTESESDNGSLKNRWIYKDNIYNKGLKPYKHVLFVCHKLLLVPYYYH